MVYRFNDFQNSIGESLIKIRHTLVTDNYLAAEEIQNQDWEYFIERVIEVFKFNNPSIRPDEEFLLSTIENVTIAKQVYTMIYNVIARNFSLTISKLSVDEKKDINDDFLSQSFWYKDCLTDLNSWISFYYLYGRFPGLKDFTNVPFADKPIFLKTETTLSLPDLYSKFSAADAKGLVSLHVLAALNIYFGGERTIS